MMKDRNKTKMTYPEFSKKVILCANELFILILGAKECYCVSWDLLGINIKYSLNILDSELIRYQNLTNMKCTLFLNKDILPKLKV